MNEIIGWIMAHPFLSLVIAHAAASVIVKLTPTQVDNRILEKLLKLAEKLALNNVPVNSTKAQVQAVINAADSVGVNVQTASRMVKAFEAINSKGGK